jgi:serine/threonine protein kinase
MFVSSGTVIDGKYEVRRAIGSGGMGVVYEAYQQDMDRMVALKLLTAVDEDPEEYSRFLREARVLNQLSHPNIVQFYAYGVWQGCPYIAMEEVHGQSLHQLIVDSDTGIDPALAFEIAIQICDGLESAHSQSLIHRDIKPSNIILTTKTDSGAGAVPKVKLIDFGLARMTGVEAAQKITKTGVAIGSVNYMSPEQCVGKAVDARTDIYSLGCVLYQCLIGEPPFAADNGVAVMFQHLQEPISSAVGWNRLSTQQQQVIAKCLAKNVKHRYQSVSELAQDLQDLRSGAAPSSTPVSLEDASSIPFNLDKSVFGVPSGPKPAAPERRQTEHLVLLAASLVFLAVIAAIVFQLSGGHLGTTGGGESKPEISILEQNRAALSKLNLIADPREAVRRASFFQARHEVPEQIACLERGDQLVDQGRADPALAYQIKRWLAEAYSDNGEEPKAKKKFLESIEAASKSNVRMLAEANHSVAVHCCQHGKVQEGLKYARAATVLAEQAVKDEELGTTDERERLAAGCWGVLAQLYEDDHRLEEALALREKSLKHSLLQNDLYETLVCYSYIARNLRQQQNLKEAKRYMTEWRRLELQVKDNPEPMLVAHRGSTYLLMGDIERAGKDEPAANKWYQAAVDLYKAHPIGDLYQDNEAVALTYLAVSDYELNDLKQGDEVATAAFALWNTSKDERGRKFWPQRLKESREAAEQRNVAHSKSP